MLVKQAQLLLWYVRQAILLCCGKVHCETWDVSVAFRASQAVLKTLNADRTVLRSSTTAGKSTGLEARHTVRLSLAVVIPGKRWVT